MSEGNGASPINDQSPHPFKSALEEIMQEPPTELVEVFPGKPPLRIRAIDNETLAGLYIRFPEMTRQEPPVMDENGNVLNVFDPEQLRQRLNYLPHFIAAGIVNPDTGESEADNPRTIELARKLPMSVQAQLLARIMWLTVPGSRPDEAGPLSGAAGGSSGGTPPQN